LLDFWFVASGTIFGYLAGLIPGVGNVIMMLLMWPLLSDATLLQMLLFYLGLISACQFSGSVVATVFGVPGESSSMPAVIEGNRMFHRGVGNFAISNAALGSVVGSAVSVFTVFLLLPIAVEFIKDFYNNNIQLIILLVASMSIIFLLGTSWLINMLVFGLGLVLGMIGFNHVPFGLFMQNFLPYETFESMKGGLPFFPVIASLYVFPVLLNTMQQSSEFNSQSKYIDNVNFKKHLSEFKNNIASSIRGSAFGSVIGLIPHVGTSVSSNLSYAIEKNLGLKQKTYNNNGDIKSLVAAETANNSTGFTSLMPLMLLGIPITASEAILLSYIEANSLTIDYRYTVESGMFITLALYFVFVNLLCFMVSWPAVSYINYIKKVKMNIILFITGIAIVTLVLYNGYLNYNIEFYFGVMVALAPVGYLLRKAEPMVLMIAFILQDRIVESSTAFWQIHFS